MRLFIIVMLGAMLIAGLFFYVVFSQYVQSPQAPDYNTILMQSEGGIRTLMPPREVRDFRLTDQNGKAFNLHDLKGQYTLLYFGYTHCPDVCLLTLSDYRKIRKALGDEAGDFQYVFISVDGERDTPAIIKRYFKARRVEDFMIGLTADKSTIDRLGVDYDLYYQLNKEATDDNNYSVDHSARIYLVNPQQQLSAIFAFGTEPEAIAEYLLEEKNNT